MPDRQFINNYCPITGKLIEERTLGPSRLRVFEGQLIGFCSDKCPRRWDELSDQSRAEHLNDIFNVR